MWWAYLDAHSAPLAELLNQIALRVAGLETERVATEVNAVRTGIISRSSASGSASVVVIVVVISGGVVRLGGSKVTGRDVEVAAEPLKRVSFVEHSRNSLRSQVLFAAAVGGGGVNLGRGRDLGEKRRENLGSVVRGRHGDSGLSGKKKKESDKMLCKLGRL